MQIRSHHTAFSLLFLIVTLLVGAVAPTTLVAAPGTCLKEITTADGLPDNRINDFCQDKFGFIWAATWNGVARYDGVGFAVYRHSDADSTSLINNMVRSLLPADDGIWIGTDNGLDFFSYATGEFCHCCVRGDNLAGTQRLTSRVSRVKRGPDGRIFGTTIGGDLLRYETTEGGRPIFSILPNPRGLRNGDICPLDSARMLALSDKGITVLAADGERVLRYNNIKIGFAANMNIFYDAEEHLVYVGRGIGKDMLTYAVDADGRLTPMAEAPQVSGLMRVTKAGNATYFATDGSGVLVRSGAKGQPQRLSFNPGSDYAGCDAFYTVFTDQDDHVWCGTYRHGIYVWSGEGEAFHLFSARSGALSHNIVTSAVVDSTHIFLALDGGGVDVLDRASRKRLNINALNSALPNNNVVSLARQGDTLYMALYTGGLFAMHIPSGAIRMVEVPGEPNLFLWTLMVDSHGRLWIGGEGLHYRDPVSGEIITPEGCESVHVNSIVQSPADGTIWVGTRSAGLLKISADEAKVLCHSSPQPTPGGVTLPGLHVLFVGTDSKGFVWISLANSIFYRLDPRTQELKLMGAADGLVDVKVQSMTEDAEGNLWVGTSNGLFRYVSANGNFVRVGDSHLLTCFNNNAATRCGQHLFFGSVSGLLDVSLDDLDIDRVHDNSIVFTDLQVLHTSSIVKSLYVSGTSGSVTLQSHENFFRVNFSAPNVGSDEQSLFQFQLEGLEQTWQVATHQRSASYTNVQPGCYRLLVRQLGHDGIWTQPSVLTIRILPPWYATWWVMLIWIVLGVGAVVAAYAIWHDINHKKQQLREMEMQRHNEEKLNEMKFDFYAKMAHELRTPSFLISAQIEELYDSDRKSVPIQYLNGIYRAGSKIAKLINNIIDFRELDSGLIHLKARAFDLTSFIADLVPEYENLCRQKAQTFVFLPTDKNIVAVLDPDKIEIVVTNLISNAFKYTNVGGTIKLTLRETDNNICIVVADNGIGISEANREKIFDPYYRTESGQNTSSGDGIGLAFVRELVDLHGGGIELESAVGQGSTFTVLLPKNIEPSVSVTSASTTASSSAPKDPTVRSPKKPDPQIAEAAQTPVATVANPTATRMILVVDDDPEVRNLLARNLEGNYRVVCAQDGAEAIDILRKQPFDMIVTDLMMPNLDGHALIRTVKSDPKLAYIKIVVFSAVTSDGDIIKTLDAKVDDFITKPVSLKVLRARIEKLFDQKTEDFLTMPNPQTEGGGPTYSREEQRFLSEIRRVIDESLLDDEFGIPLIASRLAMSHSALYKKVHRLTGLSLIDFISSYRIYKAVSLFRGGAQNVQQVAAQCGFRDVKTFRESFKRKMGMSPKQYILSLQKH